MREMFKSLGEIHGLSWILTIALDLVWNFPDALAIFSIFGIPYEFIVSLTIFIICFVIVTLIQRIVSEDEWEKAVTKAVVMGALAAVPFSIVTFIGRSIYKGLQQLVTETKIGSVIRPWVEFETRAIAKAKVLGMKPWNGYYEMATVIPFLVRQGVIEKSDEAALQAIRSEKRNPAAHYLDPKVLGHQEESLLQKYTNIL